MTPAIQKKLADYRHRLTQLEEQMAQGEGDWQEMSVEHGKLQPIVAAYEDWCKADATFREATDMLDDVRNEDIAEGDMLMMVEAEIQRAQQARDIAATRIRELLSPDAAENRRNCFVEIRAAVGGNESCLFAADLLRLYTRAADLHGWRSELVSSTAGEVGGYKEVILKILGANAYGRLKFESGAHRVQRVPQTESQGRVHTSIVTVAVLAEVDDNDDDLHLSPDELRIETFRASGAGGQHVNTTDSAVRITHIPSGVVAECQDDRSQHKNRALAMSVLKARIINQRRRERLDKEASERRLLVGSGDRSDRIRTYNFPQGRLTDHRIGLTLYRLAAVMEGEIEEILDALAKADAEDRALAD